MNVDDDGLLRLDGRLDEHARVLNQHTRTLHGHTQILQEHRQILDEHTQTLHEHTQTLHEHTQLLHEHTQLLQEIKQGIAPIAELQDFIHRVAGEHDERIKALEKPTGLRDTVDGPS